MNDATYNYRLQVWTIDGIVQTCGHPQSMRLFGPCCNQYRYQGMTVSVAMIARPLQPGPPRVEREAEMCIRCWRVWEKCTRNPCVVVGSVA